MHGQAPDVPIELQNRPQTAVNTLNYRQENLFALTNSDGNGISNSNHRIKNISKEVLVNAFNNKRGKASVPSKELDVVTRTLTSPFMTNEYLQKNSRFKRRLGTEPHVLVN